MLNKNMLMEKGNKGKVIKMSKCYECWKEKSVISYDDNTFNEVVGDYCKDCYTPPVKINMTMRCHFCEKNDKKVKFYPDCRGSKIEGIFCDDCFKTPIKKLIKGGSMVISKISQAARIKNAKKPSKFKLLIKNFYYNGGLKLDLEKVVPFYVNEFMFKFNYTKLDWDNSLIREFCTYNDSFRLDCLNLAKKINKMWKKVKVVTEKTKLTNCEVEVFKYAVWHLDLSKIGINYVIELEHRRLSINDGLIAFNISKSVSQNILNMLMYLIDGGMNGFLFNELYGREIYYA